MENILSEKIKSCELCKLQGDDYALPRIHRGTGKKVMFIGEAPGKNEAEQHISFIGLSGKLLDKWINYMGINNYYITNVVKHRPILKINGTEYNRTPYPKEIDSCLPYLFDEIVEEKPDIIITLGKTPRDAFVGTNDKMTKSVESYLTNPYNYHGAKLFVLFHPSYILRSHLDMGKYLDRIKEELQ